MICISCALNPVSIAVDARSTGTLSLSSTCISVTGAIGAGVGWDVVVIALGLADCTTAAVPATTGHLDDGRVRPGNATTTFVTDLMAMVAMLLHNNNNRSIPAIYVTTPSPAAGIAGVDGGCIAANNRAAAAAMTASRGPDSVAGLAAAVAGYCGGGGGSGNDMDSPEHCRILAPSRPLLNTSDAGPSGLQFAAVVVAGAVQCHLPAAKIACTEMAHNGTAVRCEWPPPPTPPPTPRPPQPPVPWAPCSMAAVLGCFRETKDHLVLPRYAGSIDPNGNVTIERCSSVRQLRYQILAVSRAFLSSTHPVRAVYHAFISVHADVVLVGAWNPML